MTFYLAPSLRQCPRDLGVVSPLFPRRGTSDGWVGDTSHQARRSDHNPDYSANGVVRAIDLDIVIGVLKGKSMSVVAAAIAHEATQYVIHNGYIWNRKDGFTRRKYNGSNPHTKHVHISIRHTKSAENSTARWSLPGTEYSLGDRVLYLTDPQMVGKDVEAVQRWAGLIGTEVDGAYGPRTEAAVKARQELLGLSPDGRVGPATVSIIITPPTITQPPVVHPPVTAPVPAIGGPDMLRIIVDNAHQYVWNGYDDPIWIRSIRTHVALNAAHAEIPLPILRFSEENFDIFLAELDASRRTRHANKPVTYVPGIDQNTLAEVVRSAVSNALGGQQ